MSSNIFISNVKTNRPGRGALSYRELDNEQGEYVVNYVGGELLNARRNTSLGSMIFWILVTVIDIALVAFFFKHSVLLGSVMVGINGIFMIAIGIIGIKQFSKGAVFESAKVPAAALVKDSYYVDFKDKDHLDAEGDPIHVKGYIPIYECEYNGHKYIFERQRPEHAEKKQPIVGRKIDIMLDEYEPEKTVFSDDLERYIGDNKRTGMGCLIAGIITVLFAAIIIVGAVYLSIKFKL